MNQPTYTTILKRIRKAKTVQGLERHVNALMHYSGKIRLLNRLFRAYNNKNHKLRNKK